MIVYNFNYTQSFPCLPFRGGEGREEGKGGRGKGRGRGGGGEREGRGRGRGAQICDNSFITRQEFLLYNIYIYIGICSYYFIVSQYTTVVKLGFQVLDCLSGGRPLK